MYLGIDPSLTCTGLCILDKSMEIVDYKAVSFGQDVEYRLRKYHSKINKFINENNIKYIGMEAYAYGKAGASMAFNIGELGGIYKLIFQQNKLSFIRPLPTELKKFITNDPRAEKEEVQEVLEGDYGYELEHDDEVELLDLYDACAIAVITYYYFRRKKRKKLKVFQKEILKKIEARERKESLKISR